MVTGMDGSHPQVGGASEAASQLSLAIDYSAEVEQAFVDGRLYLLVDDERNLNPHLLFVDPPKKWDGRGALVHVISKPAGGEIRGFILIDGRLHMRLPNYAGAWPELDAAVSRRMLNAEVRS